MIPVVATFADEASADEMIAVLEIAGATDIKKKKKDGKVIVTFNEPED